MGVVVFADHFTLPRMGLRSEYSYQHRPNEDSCQATNWPAVVAWVSAEIISLPLALLTPVTLIFVPVITIPVSFALYVGSTKLFVRKGWMEYKDKEGPPEDGDSVPSSSSDECEA